MTEILIDKREIRDSLNKLLKSGKENVTRYTQYAPSHHKQLVQITVDIRAPDPVLVIRPRTTSSRLVLMKTLRENHHLVSSPVNNHTYSVISTHPLSFFCYVQCRPSLQINFHSGGSSLCMLRETILACWEVFSRHTGRWRAPEETRYTIISTVMEPDICIHCRHRQSSKTYRMHGNKCRMELMVFISPTHDRMDCSRMKRVTSGHELAGAWKARVRMCRRR